MCPISDGTLHVAEHWLVRCSKRLRGTQPADCKARKVRLVQCCACADWCARIKCPEPLLPEPAREKVFAIRKSCGSGFIAASQRVLQCKQRGHACGNLLTRARRSPARNRILKILRQRALSFRALEVQYFVLAHSVQNFRMNPAGYGDTFPPMTTGLICLPQLRFSQ